MEIKDGMVDITWLGPESWLGVRLGIWILVAFVPILLFLTRHVFAKQDWYRRLNGNALLQRRLFYTMTPLLLLAMVYAVYLLVLQLLNGVRDNGFVWIPQGVLVSAAVGLFYAKCCLLLRKPLAGAGYPGNWKEGYVGVFRDGLEFGMVGLLLGLAAGDRLAVDEAAFGFGILGIILSITGETIRCFRHLRSNPPHSSR